MKYEIIESPTNGTTGQNIGTFDYADLPARFQADIDADETGEWEFQAISEGDSGDVLPDLNVIVRSVAPTYDALIGYWNGACYETLERQTLDADTLSEAIAEVKKMTWDTDEDYDIQVTIEDEDGDTVHTESFGYSVAENKQGDMDETWSDEAEFSTAHLGVKDGEWFTWTANGGKRGAHDRMDGSGRWIERYDDPDAATVQEVMEWLGTHASMDADEALDAMAEHDGERAKADLINEVGERVTGDKFRGIVRVGKIIYGVDFSDVTILDGSDRAQEFAEEHDLDIDAIHGLPKHQSRTAIV